MNIKKIILMMAGCLMALGLHAQTVRTVTVAQGQSYTDHLSLKVDSKDMDMMVKFVFDEDANQLSVSLISYRTIFVFWDRVRLKPLVKGRTIRPDQLPYVVTYDPKDKYKITKLFKSTVPKPRKSFYFQRWMDYDGLQPVPQEYNMVNDYITQTFDILNKRNLVTFSLHDIFLMDKTEKKKYNLYEIPFGRDVNIEYQVTIQRNPCLEFGDEIASSQKALEGLTTSFKTLKKNYGGGKALSQEALKAFEDLKKNLLEQYPPKTDSTPCPDLTSVWETYNQYVDSVKSIHCVLAQDDNSGGELGIPTDNGKVILMKARQLDRTVSRWLVSKDANERRDLIRTGQGLIDEVNGIIGNRQGSNQAQRQAISMFRAAERYFNNTCKGNK
jgi:hypothetical protein